MQIAMNKRERYILDRVQSAREQTLCIPIGATGDMTAANRMRNFGWLDIIPQRTFRITEEGRAALQSAKAGSIG